MAVVTTNSGGQPWHRTMWVPRAATARSNCSTITLSTIGEVASPVMAGSASSLRPSRETDARRLAARRRSRTRLSSTRLLYAAASDEEVTCGRGSIRRSRDDVSRIHASLQTSFGSSLRPWNRRYRFAASTASPEAIHSSTSCRCKSSSWRSPSVTSPKS